MATSTRRPSAGLLLLIGSLACIGGSVGVVEGCHGSSDDADSSNAAVTSGSDQLTQELQLLGGSEADLRSLGAMLDQRSTALGQQKDAATAQATADVGTYTAEQWDRSWFRRDEHDAAVSARAKDIFDRPQKRELDGTKAKKAFVEDLIKVVHSGRAGTASAPTFDAWILREGYYETGISLVLNSQLGLDKQAGKILTSAIAKQIAWIHDATEKTFGHQTGTEAINIDRTVDPGQYWRMNPISSSTWHARRPDEITPQALFRGPWYNAKGRPPRIPQANEVWTLDGLRSQASDGAHAAVDIAFQGAKLKMKFQRDNDNAFFVEPAYARLLWAMGYETDPQYLLQNTRVEPRVFLSAFAAQNRVGIRIPRHEDEIIPGRPPAGVAIAGMDVAPGPKWLTVRFKDGHEVTGSSAFQSLQQAMDNRPMMDSMDSVLVGRAYAEADDPANRDGDGPWDYDAVNHVDEREIRAIGIIMVGWMGSNDLKFNNVRFDVDRSSGIRPLPFFHTLSDVGGTVPDLGWEVGVRWNQPHLHPGTNRIQIDAFDRATLSDARWGIGLIARLTEEQIVACLAAGAFDAVALGKMAEKMISRRDDLVKSFGLQNEFGLLRPNGPNKNPPPRQVQL
jgi:hypothetical protein